MSSTSYKETCSRPDVVSTQTLSETARVLRQHEREDNVQQIDSGLVGVMKPENHESPVSYDFFQVRCSRDVTEEIIDLLTDELAGSFDRIGNPGTETDLLESLIDDWYKVSEIDSDKPAE